MVQEIIVIQNARKVKKVLKEYKLVVEYLGNHLIIAEGKPKQEIVVRIINESNNKLLKPNSSALKQRGYTKTTLAKPMMIPIYIIKVFKIPVLSNFLNYNLSKATFFLYFHSIF